LDACIVTTANKFLTLYLSSIDLLFQGIIHGDIRCRNIYVAEHGDNVFKVSNLDSSLQFVLFSHIEFSSSFLPDESLSPGNGIILLLYAGEVGGGRAGGTQEGGCPLAGLAPAQG